MLPEELKAIEERDKKRLILLASDRKTKEDISALLSHIDELKEEIEGMKEKKTCKGCVCEPNAGVSGYCRDCLRLAIDRYKKED